MARSKLDGLTHEAFKPAEQQLNWLLSLFPTDRCREMVAQRLFEQQLKLSVGDPVIFPAMEEQRLKEIQADLESENLPGEMKQEMEEILSLMGKRQSEFSLPSSEQVLARLENEVYTACHLIVVGWLKALDEAHRSSIDKPVRLNDCLLPPVELVTYDGVGWDEELVGDLVLSVEQIRDLMSDFSSKLIHNFEAILDVQPDGVKFDVFEVTIRKDANGFYLPAKTKG